MIEKKAIYDFLTSLANRDIQIGDNDSLLASRLLDSLKIVELVAFLETQYQVNLTSEELIPDNLDTVNAIVALLERKGVA
jgi:acyl carrier protein